MLTSCVECRLKEEEAMLTEVDGSGLLCMSCFRPDIGALRKVADRLRAYVAEAPAEETELDMSTGQIWQRPGEREHQCKTVACVAGHYFMAFLHELEEAGEEHPWRFERESLPWEADTDPVLLDEATKFRAGYHMGANMIARDLGFKSDIQLMSWARKHADLWGCEGGEMMFGSHYAYARTNDEPLSVGDFADWIERVALRVALEGRREWAIKALRDHFPNESQGTLEGMAEQIEELSDNPAMVTARGRRRRCDGRLRLSLQAGSQVLPHTSHPT